MWSPAALVHSTKLYAKCLHFVSQIIDLPPPHTPAHTHTFLSYPSFSAHCCAACGLSELMTNLFMSRESFSVFHFFFFFLPHPIKG